METIQIEKAKKDRIVIYVDPHFRRWLWRKRADTRKSVSEIAMDLMLAGIGKEDDTWSTSSASRTE